MSVTINIDGLSLCHKGSNGISTATVPDVCKTPTPGGPVPTPYPNISMSSDLADGSTTVTADGGNMIAIKGSSFSRSTGDEPGTLGGVKSSVNMKASKWVLYSFDVKIDGENACRLTDKKTQNNENAVDAGGLVQAPLVTTPAICKELEETLKATTQPQKGKNGEIYEPELPPSRTEGATVAIGLHTPGGGAPSSLVGAASSISLKTVTRGYKHQHFSQGINHSPARTGQKTEPREPPKSNVKPCGGGTYTYQQTPRPTEGHAEAKIIEDLFKAAGGRPTGTLILKIGGAKTKPCEHCARLIKAVNQDSQGKECGDFKIIVCE